MLCAGFLGHLVTVTVSTGDIVMYYPRRIISIATTQSVSAVIQKLSAANMLRDGFLGHFFTVTASTGDIVIYYPRKIISIAATQSVSAVIQ